MERPNGEMAVEMEYYPDGESVKRAMGDDDPLLMLVSHDGARILLANIDDAFEHIILLRKLDHSESDIDRYFRVVLNKQGADWTFVCPSDYRGIQDREARIAKFYNDGFDAITRAVRQIGYSSPIDIPARYRRHLESLSG